ncbi:hypothetical protein BJ742DRAFT_804344 [Cladochytrium replicatum]|nr:hypothetical protein BJ742DRAFT_804344 [Cladochytrium replicatum]
MSETPVRHAIEAPPLESSGSDAQAGSLKLDDLGPMVINADGTMSRISNWAQMTEGERRNVGRVLLKRNRARLQQLQADQPEGDDTEQSAPSDLTEAKQT